VILLRLFLRKTVAQSAEVASCRQIMNACRRRKAGNLGNQLINRAC
jgi:hypothetical protein